MQSVIDKQHALDLIERLDAGQLAAVVHLLEVMADPVSHKLASASVENESIDAAEERSVAEAKEWRKHNKPIAMDEVLADLGLTMDDFRRMAETPLPLK